MKMRAKKVLLISVIVVAMVAISYRITDKFLILDKRDETYGIYDFGRIPIDAEVEVTGTGKQHVGEELVSTRMVIQKVLNMQGGIHFQQGEEISVYERYDILSNRNLYPIPFMPGRSVTGMGTGYQRLQKNEAGTVELSLDKTTGRIWVISVVRK